MFGIVLICSSMFSVFMSIMSYVQGCVCVTCSPYYVLCVFRSFSYVMSTCRLLIMGIGSL